MKATLEFNLPDEQYEFDAALKGRSAILVIETVYEELFRQARKYGSQSEEAESLEKRFLEILNDYDIGLE